MGWVNICERLPKEHGLYTVLVFKIIPARTRWFTSAHEEARTAQHATFGLFLELESDYDDRRVYKKVTEFRAQGGLAIEGKITHWYEVEPFPEPEVPFNQSPSAPNLKETV